MALTGRCRSGSCAYWGSAAWLASCRGPLSGFASCSGSPRPAAAPAEAGRGSSLPSPPWGQ